MRKGFFMRYRPILIGILALLVFFGVSTVLARKMVSPELRLRSGWMAVWGERGWSFAVEDSFADAPIDEVVTALGDPLSLTSEKSGMTVLVWESPYGRSRTAKRAFVRRAPAGEENVSE